MATESWLQPHLEAVLRNGCSVLSSWRNQIPTLQGRIKNFENWLLVELNHQLLGTGFARKVLTNGFFAEGKDTHEPKRVRAADVSDLRGPKSKATYLSADLSVKPTSGGYLIAEIKTGMAWVELSDDLKIVRHYNRERIADRAELGWVVILPTDSRSRRSCEKTFGRICDRLRDEADFLLRTSNIADGLLACVVVPSTPPRHNTRLHRAAATGKTSGHR